MSQMTRGQAAELLARNGYQPIPIPPGQKRCLLPNWPNYRGTADELLAWGNAGGVGLVCGDIVGIDIDVLDETLALAMQEAASRLLGPTLVRVGRAPKRLMLYRAAAPFGKKHVTYVNAAGVTAKLEVLAKGQQFVAYGTHPDTQRPYQWLDVTPLGRDPLRVPARDLTTVSEPQALELLALFAGLCEAAGFTKLNPGGSTGASASIDPNDPFVGLEPPLALDDEQVNTLVMAYLPDQVDDYHVWLRVGMALHHHFQGGIEGLDLWHQWSERSDKYNPIATERRWAGFGRRDSHTRPVTLKTLLKGVNDALRAEGKPLMFHDPPQFQRTEPSARPALTLTTTSGSVRAAAKLAPPAVVENLFWADVGLLAAPGGVGKSTLMTLCGLCISTGVPFLGRAVRRPGPFVYVSVEDKSERLQARLRELGDALLFGDKEWADVDRNFHIVDVAARGLLLSGADKQSFHVAPDAFELAALLSGLRPSMIVIDPTVGLAAGDENDNQAMQGLVRAARVLQERTDACVILVAHTGKTARDDQYGARGASSLTDGSRLAYQLHRVEDKDWLDATGSPLCAAPVAAQGYRLSQGKGSYAPPGVGDMLIERRGWQYRLVKPQGEDQAAERQREGKRAQARADQAAVLAFVREEAAAGRRYSGAKLQDQADTIGMSVRRVKAAISALRADGAVTDVKSGAAGPGTNTVLVAENQGEESPFSPV